MLVLSNNEHLKGWAEPKIKGQHGSKRNIKGRIRPKSHTIKAPALVVFYSTWSKGKYICNKNKINQTWETSQKKQSKGKKPSRMDENKGQDDGHQRKAEYNMYSMRHFPVLGQPARPAGIFRAPSRKPSQASVSMRAAAAANAPSIHCATEDELQEYLESRRNRRTLEPGRYSAAAAPPTLSAGDDSAPSATNVAQHRADGNKRLPRGLKVLGAPGQRRLRCMRRRRHDGTDPRDGVAPPLSPRRENQEEEQGDASYWR